MHTLKVLASIFLSYLFSAIFTVAHANNIDIKISQSPIDLTHTIIGYICVAIFVLAYILVIAEEKIYLRKSKPVTMAAGIIWILIGIVYANNGMSEIASAALNHQLLEFAQLMLFLLVAMTYISALEERRVFEALRIWLIKTGFSYRKLFWLTGFLSFILSPVADNLTTALIMSSVVLAVGKDSPRFVSLACINIVVAANSGGAFSPFGDITTLIIWQKGYVQFNEFAALIIPACVQFIIPAIIMSFFVKNGAPASTDETIEMRRGAIRITLLFILTIITAVSFHNFLHLSPAMGMMLGLSYLQIFGFFLKRSLPSSISRKRLRYAHDDIKLSELKRVRPFNFFSNVARAEWDTLIFFFGVMMCVQGLGLLGYLTLISDVIYGQWGALSANISVGIFSALVDNVSVMFAILAMEPDMSLGHWMLVTLTVGVGGSMLSIGSAAGVALMGQAQGKYTFFSHLKWSWTIALGYAGSIIAHLYLNQSYF